MRGSIDSLVSGEPWQKTTVKRYNNIFLDIKATIGLKSMQHDIFGALEGFTYSSLKFQVTKRSAELAVV